MKIGSDAHKDLFCRLFVESHQPFEPEALPWPELDADALDRLKTVPFWQEVLHTELRAGRIVTKGDLEKLVLGFNSEVASNALEVHVSALRRKLGRDLIDTVRGLGYRIPTS